MSIIVRAEVRVLPKDLDAFRDVAQRLAAASEDEPGTVQHRLHQRGSDLVVRDTHRNTSEP